MHLSTVTKCNLTTTQLLIIKQHVIDIKAMLPEIATEYRQDIEGIIVDTISAINYRVEAILRQEGSIPCCSAKKRHEAAAYGARRGRL